jgi:hypothetical protein
MDMGTILNFASHSVPPTYRYIRDLWIDKLELREFLRDEFAIFSPDVDILVRAW